ncbi:hypothetical protein OUZ56_012594 [Daphnia magna]|uniref:Uncharacterized protein n=1 Tax=Daphnia magna TaxID=35525 RepID=A0ABQ9Z3G4_9CRUS|nr:hypothetical protein OUZ56_012594 [Daphnia magna]
MTDFQRSIFTAVRKHFVDCQHFGCNFHWCQAVLKKVRDLHLATIYNIQGPNPVRDFVFCLLCLAYLPACKFPRVCDALKSSVSSELASILLCHDKIKAHRKKDNQLKKSYCSRYGPDTKTMRVSSSMPSITISVLKGLYTPYRPSSSIPEFGYPGAPKPFGYHFEYAELSLKVLEI